MLIFRLHCYLHNIIVYLPDEAGTAHAPGLYLLYLYLKSLKEEAMALLAYQATPAYPPPPARGLAVLPALCTDAAGAALPTTG